MFRRRPRKLAVAGGAVVVAAALIGTVSYQAQAANPHAGRSAAASFTAGHHTPPRHRGHHHTATATSTASPTETDPADPADPADPTSSADPSDPATTDPSDTTAPEDTSTTPPADDPATGAPSTGTGSGPDTDAAAAFPVSEAQFDQMFPNRNSFYTYSGLVAALSAYPGFATSGTANVQKLEAAAFLANVSHETGGLVYTVEQNTANYPSYCDTSQSYGCPAGTAAYYGRGPIQLSWNFNYKAAGDALGIDLLNNPNLVATDAAVSWKTGLWYWNTQSGPGTMTPHSAIVNGAGFGETIRSINGALECNGNNTAEMQDRVSLFQKFTGILGATPVGSSTC